MHMVRVGSEEATQENETWLGSQHLLGILPIDDNMSGLQGNAGMRLGELLARARALHIHVP